MTFIVHVSEISQCCPVISVSSSILYWVIFIQPLNIADVKYGWNKLCLEILCFLISKVKVLVAQPCLTLCDPIDCSLIGSSVRGIFQAGMGSQPFPYPGVLSWPRDWTWVSCVAGRLFTVWTIREALLILCSPYFRKRFIYVRINSGLADYIISEADDRKTQAEMYV